MGRGGGMNAASRGEAAGLGEGLRPGPGAACGVCPLSSLCLPVIRPAVWSSSPLSPQAGSPRRTRSMSTQEDEKTQAPQLSSWLSRDLAKSFLIGAPGGKKGQQKPARRGGDEGRIQQWGEGCSRCMCAAGRAGASCPRPVSPVWTRCGLWSGPLLPAPASRAEGSL